VESTNSNRTFPMVFALPSLSQDMYVAELRRELQLISKIEFVRSVGKGDLAFGPWGSGLSQDSGFSFLP
jgi:hypothetical protein